MEDTNSNQQPAAPVASGSNINNPQAQVSKDDEMIASIFQDILNSFKTQPNETPMDTDEGGERRGESRAVLMLWVAC